MATAVDQHASVYRIRRARTDDVARIRAVEHAAGAVFREIGLDLVADEPPPSAGELRTLVDRGDAWVLVDPDDAPVAHRLDEIVDGLVHLEQVSVAPEHARRGLGRRLIEHLLDRAGGPVTLTTYVEVPWNGPYYERLGFRYLAAAELGSGLRAVREHEIARGLDRWPRAAMIREP